MPGTLALARALALGPYLRQREGGKRAWRLAAAGPLTSAPRGLRDFLAARALRPRPRRGIVARLPPTYSLNEKYCK